MNVALEIEEDRARLVLEDPSPAGSCGIGQRVEFHAEVCPSPLCHCRDVRFVQRASEGSGEGSGEEGESRRFTLDPFGRCAAERDSPEAPESERLARQVAGAMSADSWKNLADVFMDVKARAIAEIDCGRERASFPFDEIERDGVMVSYREVVPFDREILFTDGTRELFVDEQHCVRPACDCTDAILLVLEVDRTPGPDGVRTAAEVAGLRVDHRRGRWVDADSGGPLSDEARELRRLLLARHPRLLATLGRQQAVLRDLYRTAAAAAGRPMDASPAPIVAAPRPGRNDPCPCGSGKKYKKCCLAS